MTNREWVAGIIIALVTVPLTIIVVLLVSRLLAVPSADEVKVINQKVGNYEAIKDYVSPYYQAWGHKAFAVSDSGNWGWAYFRFSPEAAKESALQYCQAVGSRSESATPCKIVNVDGVWVN